MSVFSRSVALATAAAGLLMFNDQRKFTAEESTLQEHEMVDDDYLNVLMEESGDASPHNTLKNIKHYIFNPINGHFIARPLIHIKNFAHLLRQNIIPIGLVAAGIVFGFNLNPAKLAVGGGAIIGSVGRHLFGGLRAIGGALGEAGKPAFDYLKTMNFQPLKAPSILALTALAGMGIYTAHLFKREVTGENREEAFNFMEPGPH